MGKINEVIMGCIKDGLLKADRFGNIEYRGRMDIPIQIRKGYYQVGLRYKGLQVKAKVHRIVWMYFNGEPPAHLMLDHINRNRLDNCLDNLRLVDASLSNKNGDRYGTSNHQAKLDWDKVREIRRRHSAGESLRSLAERYGVVPTTIRDVIKGISWKE